MSLLRYLVLAFDDSHISKCDLDAGLSIKQNKVCLSNWIWAVIYFRLFLIIPHEIFTPKAAFPSILTFLISYGWYVSSLIPHDFFLFLFPIILFIYH